MDMTPLHLMLLEAIVLLISYFIIDMLLMRYGKRIVTMVVMLCNIFLFPQLFYPDDTDGSRCGMPILALNLVFWLFANLVVLLTLLVYCLYNKLMKR